MGSARYRLRLPAHDQPNPERVSCRRWRVAGRHHDDLYAVRSLRMARDRPADQGIRFGGKKEGKSSGKRERKRRKKKKKTKKKNKRKKKPHPYPRKKPPPKGGGRQR